MSLTSKIEPVNYSYWIILNFFFLSTLNAIFQLINIDLQFDKILDAAILLIVIFNNKNTKISPIGFFVLLYMFYMLFTVFINDFPHKSMITYYAIKTSWIPTLFFFIGKKNQFSKDTFFEKMINPVTISLLFGILFFFTLPGWYVKMRTTNINTPISEFGMNELFRMSSFWPAPQFIGYSCFVLITYLLYKLYTSQEKITTKETVILLISTISIFLIQLRVVILGAAVSAIVYMFWNYFFGRNKKTKITMYILLSFSIMMFFVFGFLSIMHNEFLITKINTIFSFDKLVVDRVTSMTKTTAGEMFDINFFGHGFGRFGIAVSKFGMPDLRDGGYLRLLIELGYLGFSLFLFVLIPTFIKALKNIRFIPLEFCILLFYMIALVGANCTTEIFTLNIVFWLIVGRIWNPILIQKKKNEYYINLKDNSPQIIPEQ